MMCGTVYAKSMPGLAADCTVMSVVSSTSWLCWTGLILHWSCLFESSLLDSGIRLSHWVSFSGWLALSHLRCTKYTGYTELRLKPFEDKSSEKSQVNRIRMRIVVVPSWIGEYLYV
ncbi:hypothetical protein KQX54_017910 [Cotesia glomerata]|uniref:Uncharacterized protein n=1 Tax=Cotesia glomerata TaxID=32391 RepID=A0AAV7J029_COTGL|nr:hypothetical protein KQX54_017910 [Cotesia glomerata]